jgi:ABC-2 type transport system ATP-binding protein
MKQRLGIAQALLGSPDLVILDEPTSGLDPQGIREVRTLIRRLATERGMTVFLSSHLLHEIEQTATSMAIINRGSLVTQGRVADLLGGAEVQVLLEARPVESALALLAAEGITEVERNGETLTFTARRDRLSGLNRTLVTGGVEVESLVPRRSLEDYFLSLTEGASDVPTPRARRGRSTMRG